MPNNDVQMKMEDPIETAIMRMNDRETEARANWICFASSRKYGASFMRALKERSMLDPDAPDAIVVATDKKEDKWLHNHLKR